MEYPGAVCTTTIFGVLPEIVDPDCATPLATRTPINEGTVLGGFELFPGPVIQVVPHPGGSALRVFANPLNAFGAAPPLSALSVLQSELQKVTAPAALWSPMTKEPLARKANRMVLALSEDGR